MFHSVLFNYKVMVAVVTLTLTIAHIAMMLLLNLACTLTAVFSFVFMATGSKKYLSSDRAVITFLFFSTLRSG